MSTQFPVGPTRDVQPGDTPDLNDGLLSRAMAVQNIARGTACYIDAGNGLITIGTTALGAEGASPFVPIESVDNSGDDGLEMSGVRPPQRVALTFETVTGALTLYPGDYVKVSAAVPGIVNKWIDGTDAAGLKYAVFLGIEAALLDRSTTTPFDETLTPGIVPDQSVTGADGDQFVGWFQLVENPGA